MESFRFTIAAIQALPVPDRRTRYKDTGQDGLIVALTPGGARVFYVFKRVRNKLYEKRLGAVESMSVQEARERTREALAAADKGEAMPDPGRRRGGDTFGDLWAWWAKYYGEPRRARWKATEAVYKNHLEKHIGLRPMSMLTRAELKQLHQRLGAGGHERAANVAIGLARTVINRAITEGRWRGDNPLKGFEGFRRPARTRVLSAEELPRFLAAAEQAKPDLRDLVLLLLYTGQRCGNVMAMRWDELDLDRGVWVIPRTKAGRVHGVALEEPELAILRARKDAQAGSSQWVFPARTGAKLAGHVTRPSKGWKALLDRAGIDDFTIHDLRRTHGSWALSSGVSMDVVSKTLDHSSIRVTEEIYAHLDLASKREAKRRVLAAMGQKGIGPSMST